MQATDAEVPRVVRGPQETGDDTSDLVGLPDPPGPSAGPADPRGPSEFSGPTERSGRAESSQRAGRPRDFADWVERAGPSLLGFAHMVTGSGHDAADAVQDALVAVYPRWRRLQRDDATGRPFGADAYARRVIVNRTVSWWRKFTRREYLIDAVELPPFGESAAAESSLGGDPSGPASDSVLARRLLGALPAKQRAAVVLRFYDDLPFAEIAGILRCTEATARSHVHRALAALRAQLDEPESPTESDEVIR